ncbi:cyclin-D3-3-like [Punica granatum]|uniref:Cyclin-like domain-containing protein n=2 Tax=Punica granatum TaxID=22663 RepID=A0A218X7M7_PUNGR|nr:cyclin-D3-3-like [Punica granatum]OWM80690.1 hypothetical protein CDL15_Pgr006720 [Punica granatum]PKI48063.1 hypothetical protein CRG98_031580 [Punica granatum]
MTSSQKKKVPHYSTLRQDSPSLDGLYCSEQLVGETRWRDPPQKLLEQLDLSWDDEELGCLLSKQSRADVGPELAEARYGAVEWILRVHAHYGFSALTAVLAVNYLDRFLSSCSRLRRDGAPWMGQLAAVACLSLAAKVEEISVPLLVDFQVDDSVFLFEARTIKKMELLVLSTLQWRMNPVTPLSFLDHIARRLQFRDQHLHREFFRRCEDVVVSVLSDARLLQYFPSVVAAATILQVVRGLPGLGLKEEWQSQLLGTLGDDGEVVSCRKLICDQYAPMAAQGLGSLRPNKRKCRGGGNGGGSSVPGSPGGAVDYVFLTSGHSYDSWAAAPPSISSSPVGPPLKKHCPQLASSS